MGALSALRQTPHIDGTTAIGGVAASTAIHVDDIVIRNASGYLRSGATATGLVGAGVSENFIVNAGSAGDESVTYRSGVFRLVNSASGDLITIADIGKPFYVVDDQTVAKTSGANTRSIGGFIHAVDDKGVWCQFDEAMVQTYLAGIANRPNLLRNQKWTSIIIR